MNLKISTDEVSYGTPSETPAQHAKRITEAVYASSGYPAINYPVESWRRCLEDFNLDPSGPFEATPFVGNRALNDAREELGEKLTLVSAELVDLYSAVRTLGYSAGFTNRDGLFILEEADRDLDSYVSTDQPGWMWPEKIGGTNSVGTCIIDEMPTSVFGRQHFYSQSIDTACAGAPVFDPGGMLWGVLSITVRDRRLQFQTHTLAAEIVKQSALRLSEKMFRSKFSSSMIIEWLDRNGERSLIAVNADQKIDGANRIARKNLNLDRTHPLLKPLWSVFEKNTQLRRAKIDGGEIELQALMNGTIVHACVTPPIQSPSRYSSNSIVTADYRRKPLESKSVSLDECAGSDLNMLRQVKILDRIKDSGLPILLLGETGTGKDTLARAIHSGGARAEKPFVAFNCSAIQESLIDSELFGYAPGTFTGGSPTGNRGRILEANGGTLFLDEIGDMPLPLQTRLLRVLENYEVVALGTSTPQKVDVNIIAATHQDLHSCVTEGRFRRDLYYRLAGAVIEMPPLRQRTDLFPIIKNLVYQLSKGSKRLDQNAVDTLMRHAWPGNLRELGHVLRRAISFAVDHVITEDDLLLMPVQPLLTGHIPAIGQPSGENNRTMHKAIWDAEASSIKVALGRADGDVEEAAKILGISRATFYRKMQHYKIRRS